MAIDDCLRHGCGCIFFAWLRLAYVMRSKYGVNAHNRTDLEDVLGGGSRGGSFLGGSSNAIVLSVTEIDGPEKEQQSKLNCAVCEQKNKSSNARQERVRLSRSLMVNWRHHQLLPFGIHQLPCLQSFSTLLLVLLLQFVIIRDVILPRSSTHFTIDFCLPSLKLGVCILMHWASVNILRLCPTKEMHSLLSLLYLIHCKFYSATPINICTIAKQYYHLWYHLLSSPCANLLMEPCPAIVQRPSLKWHDIVGGSHSDIWWSIDNKWQHICIHVRTEG